MKKHKNLYSLIYKFEDKNKLGMKFYEYIDHKFEEGNICNIELFKFLESTNE